MQRRRAGAAAGAVALLVLAPALVARQDLTRRDADSMETKLVAIVGYEHVAGPAGRAPVRTSFTEREVNAYFRFQGREQLPPGLVNPQVTIGDAGRLEGRALVDLDAVRKSKERSMFDPLGYLTGSLEVTATGTLAAAKGVGVFKLASATLGGVSIPKSVLQELVSYYSRTPEQPNGFSLDDPFVLPASIQAIEIRRGSATVIQ